MAAVILVVGGLNEVSVIFLAALFGLIRGWRQKPVTSSQSEPIASPSPSSTPGLILLGTTTSFAQLSMLIITKVNTIWLILLGACVGYSLQN